MVYFGKMELCLDRFHRALWFAGQAHGEQRLPGSQLPYVVHLSAVAMEVVASAATAGAAPEQPPEEPFDLQLAAICALLHDTVEDTQVTVAELDREFGAAVAQVVAALSKDAALPKAEQMADSLRRIAALPPPLVRTAAIVKLADRISNLQKPPAHWSGEKRRAYQAEARLILSHLRPLAAWAPLARRLAARIEAYDAFLADL